MGHRIYKMNSWDCFDTLIARLHYHPKTVFDEVGRRIGDPDFRAKRVNAEKASNKTYEDIYARLPGIDPQIELDVELEHNFAINENISRVKDGDLILSDMYLPRHFLMKMLRNVGLTVDVDIIVTPDGKKKGWIWENVKDRYKIKTHYGDNYKSDVLGAKENGINGIHYKGYQLNDIERTVYKQDKELALWMRCTRLLCPYSDEGDVRFWNDQANINLPVLALATLELPDTPIAFTYRDCNIWHLLYERMTGKKGYRLNVSRKMYLEPNKYFENYMSFVKDIGATIVDLQGRGGSIKSFFDNNPPKTLYISGNTADYIERLVPHPGRGQSMEKHNCFDEGPIIDFNKHGPVHGKNDHPKNVAAIHKKAGQAGCKYVNYFNFKRNKGLLTELVQMYVNNENFTDKNITWSKIH